jgi:hypothetical protein
MVGCLKILFDSNFSETPKAGDTLITFTPKFSFGKVAESLAA